MSVTDGDVDIAHIVHHCDDGTIVVFTTRKPLGIEIVTTLSRTAKRRETKVGKSGFFGKVGHVRKLLGKKKSIGLQMEEVEANQTPNLRINPCFLWMSATHAPQCEHFSRKSQQAQRRTPGHLDHQPAILAPR
jgi:hypothetical protein